ncbi:MAG: bifunctional 5,10-methylene-tetrahydrofolate dehydrogenase/5,10-methylene-tetrahydrofolate cyclohydrolase, partial [Gammaproteobacteria bacterium]|nr:bifunctional 5,10-methylene-tetrahydrofolate dehydrogenase/5,10-methylene-tetrahydrofolate cyclohydrolase [Gammaproteobacteria bacterium]
MQLLDGSSCSEQIRQEIALKVDEIKSRGERVPHLAAVLVGNDGASQNYVAFKIKDCEQVGFNSTTIRMEETTTEQELLDKIAELN